MKKEAKKKHGHPKTYRAPLNNILTNILGMRNQYRLLYISICEFPPIYQPYSYSSYKGTIFSSKKCPPTMYAQQNSAHHKHCPSHYPLLQVICWTNLIMTHLCMILID